MRRTSLLAIVAILFLGARARAQDVLTLGSEIASAGGVASIPVSILDRSGTPLGTDVGSGNRIQGFAFKVLFPTELVTSIAFTRAGIAATITPMHATALQGSGWSSCIVSFNESSNPIAFNLNTTAPGDRVGTLTVTMRGDAPINSVATLILDPPSAMLSNQTSTTRETVASGSLSLVNGSVTVSAVQAPTNLIATANGITQVSLTWTGVAGADHYEVWRSFNGGAYTLAGSPAAAAFTDSSVSANTTYLYRVRAIDGVDPSGYSNIDLATTIVFTDDPVVATSTIVKAVHLTQLRTAVNSVRASAGLAPLGSDPTVGVGLAIRAQHITDLRTALNAARTAVSLTAVSFTDTPPVIVKAVHVQELRNGVK
ncbi:MAG TPA: fibronectin type III domain-containing protein [Thermoanaerobaculia bacterium]|jgi:hypothetical protein|nr:fibronectin type III domain-containing protein [Thermoanaerobaculia bacterium]